MAVEKKKESTAEPTRVSPAAEEDKRSDQEKYDDLISKGWAPTTARRHLGLDDPDHGRDPALGPIPEPPPWLK